MRQIKFRGQRIDTKEWVYGDVIHYDSGEIKILEQNYRIWDILEGAYEVIPESVGQFTGLQDKNGNKVYEGDIVKVKGTKKTLFYDTEIIHNGLGFMLKENKTYLKDYKMVSSMIEIIGNIHETKNL